MLEGIDGRALREVPNQRPLLEGQVAGHGHVDLELDPFANADYSRTPSPETRAEPPTSDEPILEEMRSVLQDVERSSVWDRFM